MDRYKDRQTENLKYEEVITTPNVFIIITHRTSGLSEKGDLESTVKDSPPDPGVRRFQGGHLML